MGNDFAGYPVGGGMPESKITRRSVIESGLKLGVLGTAAAALAACDQGAPKIVCAGPNNLTLSENSLRKASNYVEEAPDPAKNCTGCGFYTADPAGGVCGKCEIFLGPVNARGHCDSWAAKEAKS